MKAEEVYGSTNHMMLTLLKIFSSACMTMFCDDQRLLGEHTRLNYGKPQRADNGDIVTIHVATCRNPRTILDLGCSRGMSLA
jgi:hypothetical protein